MTLTYTVRIDPDGTITTYPEPAGAGDLARAACEDRCDVVSLRAPWLPRYHSGLLVGYVDDFGVFKSFPINRKAWALYGRSPIHGTMWVKDDDDMPIGADLLDLLASPGYPDPGINAIMDGWLIDNGYGQ